MTTPPLKAYAIMADTCYKHYELALADKKMVDASRWLLRSHTYREKAEQLGYADANK